ncbi:MAG: dTDP-4-dehydrorhamnose 3,5-epimerase [Bacteroidetes bacterium]|jgi:dTDP-4-dehydrorhamnose 3,5-epimerase|nr:dTDP-4-dehydrorhamnose 3,5-epimerase [Bacteroidota bacterium]
MTWTDAPIDGCTITSLQKYRDERGWLAEFFRQDELPEALHPVMGYLSMTRPGIVRGPHEHETQTDLFVFFSGRFRLYLWDGREDSPTRGHRHVVELGEADPAAVMVPPGVVHAYRNVGETDALIVNCPNRLYAGEGKQEPVDEIRHEDRPDSPYVLE